MSRSILEMPTFRDLAIHFIKARSLILSSSSGPFLLYYATCWSDGGKKRIVDRGRRKSGEN